MRPVRFATRLVVGMSVLALALIGSSWALKGHPAGEWVDAALYLAMGGFFVSQVTLALPRKSGAGGCGT
jgi:hypothetical protein